jgi:hypothetical protein
MKGFGSWAIALLCLAASACGSDEKAASTLDMLDPSSVHYGKAYAEWSASWVAYINSFAPPDCMNPLLDASGASCLLDQDPQSPVFFLVGNFGGVSLRTECVVPSGKALFFPLINAWADNAGVPTEMTLPDADLKSFVASNFETYATSTLRLTVDGQEVPKLERGGIRSAPYVLNLPAGKNPYSCMDVAAEGEFPGYTGGYWAMLPPLADGPHTLRFGGSQMSASPSNDVTIDVSYDFSVR